MDHVPAAIIDLLPLPQGDDCLLVGIDGVDGSGKTTFADHLAMALSERGLAAIRISFDDFHNMRAVRFRRGRHSPDGFWLDTYNYERIESDVLTPLGRGGIRRYRPRAHDLVTDTDLSPDSLSAPANAVVVIDGLFLHRDELVDRWDLSIFLDVPFSETARRMAQRDGSNPDPEHPSMRRYVEGQRLYLAACDPAVRTDVVIDNVDPVRPRLRGQRA